MSELLKLFDPKVPGGGSFGCWRGSCEFGEACQFGIVAGTAPFGPPELLSVFGALDQLGVLVVPELGPGVIGNGLLGPAFMPSRDAARAASSAALFGVPFGHAVEFGVEFKKLGPLKELFGVCVGNAPLGGQLGIVSSGDPELDGGCVHGAAFGMGSSLGSA